MAWMAWVYWFVLVVLALSTAEAGHGKELLEAASAASS